MQIHICKHAEFSIYTVNANTIITHTQIQIYSQGTALHHGSSGRRMKCVGRKVAKFWSCCCSGGWMHVGEGFTLCKICAKFAPAPISFQIFYKWALKVKELRHAINCKKCCMIENLRIVSRVFTLQNFLSKYGQPILKHACIDMQFILKHPVTEKVAVVLGRANLSHAQIYPKYSRTKWKMAKTCRQ